MNVSFAGCGFLGLYHVGVASCFKTYAPQLCLYKVCQWPCWDRQLLQDLCTPAMLVQGIYSDHFGMASYFKTYALQLCLYKVCTVTTWGWPAVSRHMQNSYACTRYVQWPCQGGQPFQDLCTTAIHLTLCTHIMFRFPVHQLGGSRPWGYWLMSHWVSCTNKGSGTLMDGIMYVQNTVPTMYPLFTM